MLFDSSPQHATSQAIGCFGGRFDPVHWAHLVMAGAAADALQLSQVRWIVTAEPPHKPAMASAQDRLKMVALALDALNDARMVIDDREIKSAVRGKPNYTADTIANLQHEFPGRPLVWILGEDQLEQFTTWSRWEWLVQQMALVVCRRADTTGSATAQAIRDAGGTISWITIPENKTSSSLVREAARTHCITTAMCPTPVIQYIEQHGLYT